MAIKSEMHEYFSSYILENGQVVAEPDPRKFSVWFATADRQVALTRIGEVSISTVFLAINHNHSMEGPPILWETLISGGPKHGHFMRYSSLTDALAGHKQAVEMCGSVKDWSPRPPKES